MQTVLLDQSAVNANAETSAVISAVEDAFAAYERGTVQMPVKSYVDLERYNGDFRSMPAYIDAGEWDAAGIKWVNVHPDNPSEHGLPTVMGTMVYSDPETGYPLAIMDGTELTMKRTGAAAAVATDYLAIEDATSLGIVGAGVQSYTQLDAIAAVRPIEDVVVADTNSERVQAFIDAFEDRFSVVEGTIADAAACDVLSTVTPVDSPIVEHSVVGSHTHINAMGADAAGKQELTEDLLLESTVVIDDYGQTTHSGEINVPWREGTFSDEHIYGELGEIVAGKKSGRTDDDGITVFDSTGLAIQDIAAAHVVYEHAIDRENGSRFELINS
ncbi:ornithine cyclodeaminase family protein [Natrarchaeobius halalkaliphilus]|uniref:Alanine dehydrogenase n=1 Tax=Natrarchaeobius halalkaliphilus TaxID=1679091 RepID=A0A3N6LJ43_9EURY|nr:ornithine cyclodeaminase family protein [Natrarchaeobius halalkaliphilus]RQG88076.1 ornithine cyclodeaminase family protein [Natrarchaeobius halalkaliphilus]